MTGFFYRLRSNAKKNLLKKTQRNKSVPNCCEQFVIDNQQLFEHKPKQTKKFMKNRIVRSARIVNGVHTDEGTNYFRVVKSQHFD